MIRTKSGYPKIVHRPETLRIGDKIRVTYTTENDGITRIKEGTISHREHVGRNTMYTTSGGGLLFGIGPAIRTPGLLILEPAPELETVALWNDRELA
jgi:hypothetical protein